MRFKHPICYGCEHEKTYSRGTNIQPTGLLSSGVRRSTLPQRIGQFSKEGEVSVASKAVLAKYIDEAQVTLSPKASMTAMRRQAHIDIFES